jgi:hypothetical protein
MNATRRRAGWLALLFAIVAAAVSAAPAAAATKPYSLVIAPGTVPNGTVTMTAKYTNENGTQSLGSSNLAPPAGFTIVSASLPQGSSGTASVVSNVLQLRGLGLAAGGSLTVTMSVKTPSTCSGGPYSWTVETKQSNDFSGPPGNDLTLDSANSSLTTSVSGGCGIVFGTQPTNALVGQHITGSAYNPSGPPLTAKIVDGSGNVITSSSAPVTVAIGNNAGSGTLSGTLTENAVNGVATFADLSIDKPGSGYTLSASAPNSGSTTSSSFNEDGGKTSCTQSSTTTSNTCTTNSSGSSNSSANVTASGNPQHLETTTMSEAPDLGNDTLTCPSLSAPSNDWYTYEIGSNFWSKLIKHTERPTSFLGGTSQAIVSNEQACFGATADFMTRSGSMAPPATLPDGAPGFIGDLPNCGTAGATVCVQSRSSALDLSSPIGFDLVLTILVPAGFADDPASRCC